MRGRKDFILKKRPWMHDTCNGMSNHKAGGTIAENQACGTGVKSVK